MEKVILELNGPMCAGKSSVASALMEKKEGFYLASYDKQKWLISNFSRDNREHRKLAWEIVYSVVRGAVEQGLSVIVDSGHHEHRHKYKELADKYGYTYLSINIEAPYEITKERFFKRVEATQKVDRPKIAVTKIEGFDAIYNWYMTKNRNNAPAASFDTSELTLEELVAKIDVLFESNSV